MERRKFDTESLETLIHIKGKDKSLEDIAELYIEKMEEGFNLTAEEMASYLKCSYRHVLKFQSHIRHIVIDQHVGRRSLVIHKQDHEKFGHLFTNRKLFYRPDFVKYILENAELVTTYRQYTMEDFDPKVIEHLTKTLKKWTPRQFISDILTHVHKEIPADEESEKVEKLSCFPEELHSVTSLMQHGFLTNPEDPESRITWTHDRYIYHFLRNLGVKKVRIGNIIRYRREDLTHALRNETVIGAVPMTCKKADVVKFAEYWAWKEKKD